MNHKIDDVGFSTSLMLPRSRSGYPVTTPRKLSWLLGAACLAFTVVAQCDLALNFAGPTTTTVTRGVTTITGQTPFTSNDNGFTASGDLVVDPSTGLSYWHYIVGDPSTGFAQEVYIQAGGVSFTSSLGTCGENSICTASGGYAADPVGNASFNVLGNNLGATPSGNGSGNPSDVIIRQVIGGTWNAATSTWTCDTSFCSEFIKASFSNKPEIIQGINDTDFTASFILDLSGIALSNNSTNLTLTDKNTAPTGSSLTNVQTLIDPTTGNAISSWDMAHDSQNTFVTGGKYTYVSGPGNLGASGTYVYVDGGYNPTNVDYTPFLDETDPTNIWAYPAAKP